MSGEHPLISCDAEILGGKPRVRGTRLSVEFLLELLAGGASQERILDEFPFLTAEGLEAAIRYAAARMKEPTPKAS